MPTRFVEANGIRLAYRRFGKAAGVPLVLNQHLTGTLGHWDPLVTDGLAQDREVILFTNAGIARSSGEVPTTVDEMGVNAIAFVQALALDKRNGQSNGGVDRPPESARTKGSKIYLPNVRYMKNSINGLREASHV